MTESLVLLPLWSVARERRETVDPTSLGEKVVHYSIPSVDAVGTGRIENSEDIKSAKLRLHGGEVLISKLNPRKSRVVQVEPSSLPMVSSTEFVGIQAGETLSPRFLAYALQAESVRQGLDARVESATRSHQRVDPSDIMRLLIPMRDLQEQRRIVDLLDAMTNHISMLSAARIRQLAVLEERSYAQVSEIMVPGILTNPLGRWPWGWLPAAEAESPLVRLGYVCRLQNGLTVDGNRDVSGDTVTRPYLRVANVQSGYVDLNSIAKVTVPRDTARRCTLRPGDVLMTEGGDLDKLGRGTVWEGQLADCLHQNHVFALRPEIDRLDGDYLAFMTQTVHGRCYFESTGSKTTNLASTNSSKILSFPIPLPPVSRQRELARGVRSKLDAIGRAKKELHRQLELLAERRRALITAALAGQIDISTASGRGIED